MRCLFQLRGWARWGAISILGFATAQAGASDSGSLPATGNKAEARAEVRRLEVAVLHQESGKIIALPVLTLPTIGAMPTSAEFDRRVRSSNASGLGNCVGDLSQGEIEFCVLESDDVQRHFDMGFVPRIWYDSNGQKFLPLSGLYFEMPHTGSGIGFELKPEASTFNHGYPGIALLSHPTGFPRKRTVPPAEWRTWPELTMKLREWARSYQDACDQEADCALVARRLAAPNGLAGKTIEFRLADGTTLQYLSARSTNKRGRNIAVHFWRKVMPDGKAKVFGDDYWGQGVSLIELCDDKCGSAPGSPDVVAFHGRVFVLSYFDAYEGRGFSFQEIVDGELIDIGSYYWGS